ncbi:serine/threonine-protein phosphatase 7 long form homolog [Cicer arietinum]|nr:serine/threonine-protein phosphatase 7 long form homolog [Cicer arietinum]
MVERWRPETHTFHLPIGECTITLEDVYYILGLNVSGLPVSGSNFVQVKQICQDYLGVIPPDGATKGNSIKLKWLKDTFDDVGENASELEKQASCRAYILRMIGGLLMPDKSNNRVHLKYLSLLGDLNKVSQYSWGSAVLATLYRELCLATKPGVISMGGCALLLQNWAWYRLSCVAPESPKPWIFPLAQRFNSGGLNFAKVPHNDVEGYRKTIDHMMVEEFYWRPYLGFQHEVSEEDRATWSACTYLLCYHIVEKHHTDRVTLQFGLHQQIPQPPEDMKSYHEVDMRRGIDDNWTWVWREEINHWNERHNYVLQGNIVQGVLCHSTEYMIWFRQHTKLFISVEQYLRDPRLQPPSYPRVQSTSQSTPQHQYTAGPSSSSPHIHVATEVPFYDPPPSQYYVPSVPEIPTPGYPTEDGLLYNLFGTQCTTPESAYAVFDSMYNQQSQNVMEPGGSGSNPSTAYIEENDQNDDEPEEPQLVQRARRVRRHRTCGTGGHLGGHH